MKERMLRRYLLYACAVTWVVLSGCQQAATNRSADTIAQAHTPNAAAETSSNSAANHAANSAANFDYYLFTLSWSPEYCHGHPNSPQCDGEHPGFVVHGLWPQFDNGRWPSACSSAPGLSNPNRMLDIMPDRRLIQHEWSTHGTCSGLTANQYFGAIRQAYASIKIPPQWFHPARTSTKSASEIKRDFTDANPGMSDADIAISCHNRYLTAVAFCLSKNLQPVACQAVTDCNARSIRIPAAQ